MGSADSGLWIVDCRLQIVEWGLRIVDMLCLDLTGSARTKGRAKDRVWRTAIDSPHQNVCRRDEYENVEHAEYILHTTMVL